MTIIWYEFKRVIDNISLLEFSFQKKEQKINLLIIENQRHYYTAEYQDLVKDFYLKM